MYKYIKLYIKYFFPGNVFRSATGRREADVI